LGDEHYAALCQSTIQALIPLVGKKPGAPVTRKEVLEKRFVRASYYAKLGNARVHVHLKGVLNHRLSPHREKFLWNMSG
jgi:hypothetical protein